MMLVKVIPTFGDKALREAGMRSPAVRISTPPFVSSIARSPAATGYAVTSRFGRSS